MNDVQVDDMAPSLARIVDAVKSAEAEQRALDVVGGGTKSFLARGVPGERLSTVDHCGIVSYEPTELVITARAGTLLTDIDAALSERGQMLGFEPPRFGAASTIGGVIGAGLSGPARPYRGSARDFVLGVELINGHGQVLKFGGQVMKNVAGYDVSRLVTGAFGTLGVLTEVSLRVVPRVTHESTLRWGGDTTQSSERMRELSRSPWPVTAMACDQDGLRVRMSGSMEAIEDARKRLNPESDGDDSQFWAQLRDLELDQLQPANGVSLWRLSVAPAAPEFEIPVDLFDWGGAQRWLTTGAGFAEQIRAYALASGGHATCIKRAIEDEAATFSTPEKTLMQLMQRVKASFDPTGIFNPQRYYSWM